MCGMSRDQAKGRVGIISKVSADDSHQAARFADRVKLTVSDIARGRTQRVRRRVGDDQGSELGSLDVPRSRPR
jgi:hypothetical protein